MRSAHCRSPLPTFSQPHAPTHPCPPPLPCPPRAPRPAPPLRTSSGVYDMPWKEPGAGVVLVHRWDGTSFSATYKPYGMASLRLPNAKAPAAADVPVGGAYVEESCRLVITAQDMWDGECVRACVWGGTIAAQWAACDRGGLLEELEHLHRWCSRC